MSYHSSKIQETLDGYINPQQHHLAGNIVQDDKQAIDETERQELARYMASMQ